MSKTRVFIYGSCVSRDTFEHLDPEHFELVEYVARQSVLSAYTKPVELMAPPTLKSRFQQRMITGDFSSSLRSLLATHSSATDFVLVDLTDERLGAYMLPDGSFVTRSVELIESGGEQYLPQGTKHIAFGTQQHFDYWTTAMEYIGEQMRTRMPQATIVLLDIPWAEWSETGSQTPGSFGMQAPDANPVFQSYARMAAQALGAHVISMEPSEVLSSPHHPWGDAPFHYAEKVYLEIVRRLTGAEGRVVWGPGTRTESTPPSAPVPAAEESGPAENELSEAARLKANQLAAICEGLRRSLPQTWTRQEVWKNNVCVQEFESRGSKFTFDVFVNGENCDVDMLPRDEADFGLLVTLLQIGEISFKEIPGKGGRVHITRQRISSGIVDEGLIARVADNVAKARAAVDYGTYLQAYQLPPFAA
jgi:hypothetical protein